MAFRLLALVTIAFILPWTRGLSCYKCSHENIPVSEWNNLTSQIAVEELCNQVVDCEKETCDNVDNSAFFGWPMKSGQSSEKLKEPSSATLCATHIIEKDSFISFHKGCVLVDIKILGQKDTYSWVLLDDLFNQYRAFYCGKEYCNFYVSNHTAGKIPEKIDEPSDDSPSVQDKEATVQPKTDCGSLFLFIIILFVLCTCCKKREY